MSLHVFPSSPPPPSSPYCWHKSNTKSDTHINKQAVTFRINKSHQSTNSGRYEPVTEGIRCCEPKSFITRWNLNKEMSRKERQIYGVCLHIQAFLLLDALSDLKNTPRHREGDQNVEKWMSWWLQPPTRLFTDSIERACLYGSDVAKTLRGLMDAESQNEQGDSTGPLTSS